MLHFGLIQENAYFEFDKIKNQPVPFFNVPFFNFGKQRLKIYGWGHTLEGSDLHI